MARCGNNGNSLLSWAPKSLQMVTAARKRHLLIERKTMTNLDSILKSLRQPLPTKVHLVKAMVFPVIMYGCESWTLMFLDVVLEKTLESPLDYKEIQPAHPKGNQS